MVRRIAGAGLQDIPTTSQTKALHAVKYAAVGPIAVHFPERLETNEQLKAEFPDWDLDLIASKTGIEARYIAAPDECASDLAAAACEKLFSKFGVDRKSISRMETGAFSPRLDNVFNVAARNTKKRERIMQCAPRLTACR